jgi:hypothetical protein
MIVSLPRHFDKSGEATTSGRSTELLLHCASASCTLTGRVNGGQDSLSPLLASLELMRQNSVRTDGDLAACTERRSNETSLNVYAAYYPFVGNMA